MKIAPRSILGGGGEVGEFKAIPSAQYKTNPSVYAISSAINMTNSIQRSSTSWSLNESRTDHEMSILELNYNWTWNEPEMNLNWAWLELNVKWTWTEIEWSRKILIKKVRTRNSLKRNSKWSQKRLDEDHEMNSRIKTGRRKISKELDEDLEKNSIKIAK